MDRISNTFELDCDGAILTCEIYYPSGGTACWISRHLDSVDRVRRYGNQERDQTGLIYYGFRYYMPWQMRWLAADPAGDIDGVNQYVMVKNNPTTFADAGGLGLYCPHCGRRYFCLSQGNHQEVNDVVYLTPYNQRSAGQFYHHHLSQQHFGEGAPLDVASHFTPEPVRADLLQTAPATSGGAVALPSAHDISYAQPPDLGGGELIASAAGTVAAGFATFENQNFQPPLLDDRLTGVTGTLVAEGSRATSRVVSRAASQLTSRAGSMTSSLRGSLGPYMNFLSRRSSHASQQTLLSQRSRQ